MDSFRLPRYAHLPTCADNRDFCRAPLFQQRFGTPVRSKSARGLPRVPGGLSVPATEANAEGVDPALS
jgi:hypothetical protein